MIENPRLKLTLQGFLLGAALAGVAQLGLIGSALPQMGADAGGGQEQAGPVGRPGFLAKLTGRFQPVAFDAYLQPDIIKAFHDGDFETLEKNEVMTLAYLMGLNGEISGQGVLMYVSDTSILQVVDPSLSTHLERRLVGSRAFAETSVNAGMNSLMGMLGAMAQTRQSGGSITDEINAVNRSIANGPGVSIQQIQQEGATDGRRLAALYETNRPAFERIYGNMGRFGRGKAAQP